MKKISLSAFGDYLFYFVAAFFLSIIFFNYFLYYPLNIIAAGCFACLTVLLYAKIKSVRGEKNALSENERKEYEDFILCLNIFSKEKVLSLAASIAKNRGYTAKRKFGSLYFEKQKLFVFFRFGFKKTEKADVLKILRKTGKNAETIIVAENTEEEVKTFAARLNEKIRFTDGKEFFHAAKEDNLLPKSDFYIAPEKKKKGSFRLLTDKKRAKNYLVFGSVFVILSYFVPIKIYYLVTGAVMLALAVFVKIAGKKSAN